MEGWSIKTRDEARKPGFARKFVEEYFVPYVQGTKYKYTTAREYGYKDGI